MVMKRQRMEIVKKKKKKCEGLKEKEDEANGKWRKGGGKGWK